MTRYRTRLAIVLLGAAALAGCGGGEQAPDAAVEQPAGGTGNMPGMEGMHDMGGMPMGGGMMEEMRAHMRAMEGETGERLRANLPQHRQRVANMIAQMNREMREMNMPGDAEWNATIEALREDLRRMPDMGAEELGAFMPGHRERVVRLLDMHRDMMGSMRM